MACAAMCMCNRMPFMARPVVISQCAHEVWQALVTQIDNSNWQNSNRKPLPVCLKIVKRRKEKIINYNNYWKTVIRLLRPLTSQLKFCYQTWHTCLKRKKSLSNVLKYLGLQGYFLALSATTVS